MGTTAVAAVPVGVVLDRQLDYVHRIVEGKLVCTGETLASIGPDSATPVFEIPADGSLFRCPECWATPAISTTDEGRCACGQPLTARDNVCPKCQRPRDE